MEETAILAAGDDNLIILEDEEERGPATGAPWRVLIADDEEEVHHATIFAFKNLEVHGRAIEFLHAYSAAQARALLLSHPDIAVILLDVVMESEDAGLKLVGHIRKDLEMSAVRIVLRTGQPGYAPELEVIQRYDINDYKTKSELTRTRLATTLTTAIRSYEQIRMIEASREGLSRVVHATGAILATHGLQAFCEGVLAQVTGALSLGADALVWSARPGSSPGGAEAARIVAAAGTLAPLLGAALAELAPGPVRRALERTRARGEHEIADTLICLYFRDRDGCELGVYVRAGASLGEIALNLLRVFSSNVAVGLENVNLIARLHDLAFTDPLCGLPNRRHLIDTIDAQAAAGAGEMALCIVDLMQFSDVNDALGHQCGDAILLTVAERLRSSLPAEVTVARLGSDVFGLFGRAAALDPDALRALFDRPFSAAGHTLQVSPALGTVYIEGTGYGGLEALRNASIALNRGKAARVPLCVYTRAMEQEARERVRMAQELHREIEGDGLSLHYQPQVDLRSGRVVGAEALLRWTTPDGRSIRPDIFIPVAEKAGMISLIGERVLRMAGEQAARWRDGGQRRLRMAVNVSPTEFRSPRFIDRIAEAVRRYSFAAGELELEITESVAMEDLHGAIALIGELKALGVAVAIDDFGTGFSSLGYLQQLSVDRLKIDRRFVSALFESDGRHGIPEMIIRLGQGLGLEVIAEGVETAEQATRLAQLGCHEAQGFFYCKPLPAGEFEAWLARHDAA